MERSAHGVHISVREANAPGRSGNFLKSEVAFFEEPAYNVAKKRRREGVAGGRLSESLRSVRADGQGRRTYLGVEFSKRSEGISVKPALKVEGPYGRAMREVRWYRVHTRPCLMTRTFFIGKARKRRSSRLASFREPAVGASGQTKKVNVSWSCILEVKRGNVRRTCVKGRGSAWESHAGSKVVPRACTSLSGDKDVFYV